MATVHLFLTGKGGVGKSYSASLLYQFFQKKEPPVIGYDTDPVNSTFAGYTELGVIHIPIMDGDDINPTAFDQLVNEICEMDAETQVVVDNGASCFVSLCSYLKGNDALETLRSVGHEVLFHTIVTGGQALGETLAELKSLTQHFPEIPIVVWLNPYFGEIRMDGQSFQEFKLYQEVSSSIRAIIEIPFLKQALFGKDLENLLAKKMSFDAGVNSSLPIMTRSRLKSIWHGIEQAIELARLV